MKSNSSAESLILFTNGKVWQPEGSYDEAFGIKNGHFDFVGSNKQADILKNNYHEIIDLKGRLVLPSFTDGHLHLVNGALSMKELDCTGIENFDDLKNAVKKYYSENNPVWITGGNLDVNKVLGNTENYSGNFADEIFDEVPLFINNYDHHSAICNTKTLELAGITNSVNDFAPGEIELNPKGNPTGLIRESAMTAIYKVMPEVPFSEKISALSDCINEMHKCGITCVSDITLPHELEIYRELYLSGKLNLRINSYLPFTEFGILDIHLETIKDIDNDFFSIKGFKAFWDGALGSDTALFSKNYKGKVHNGYVTELVESGRIYELAKKIDEAGYQIIIHAIGDKAVKDVLKLYSELPNTKKLRHRIEHAQHIAPEDYELFGKLGVIASVQPVHLKYDAYTVYEKLPAKLIPNTHNYYQITKYGGILNFGTDFPIVPFDTFENLRLAATRITNYGEFTPEHKIPMHECIKAYTINNAYSNHNENAAGSIAKGKVADFIVFEIYSIDDLILENSISKVYLNGKAVS